MRRHLLPALSFFACHISSLAATGFHVPDKGYDISDLLEPQRDLQINLRIPNYHYAQVPRLSTAFTGSVDFLASHEVPFRLFYDYSKHGPAQTMEFTPSRHARNQIVWLVFVMLETMWEDVDLYGVVDSCSLGSNNAWSALIHKDWIQLIVDESGITGGSWNGTYGLDMPRIYVPLNFITLTWRGTRFSIERAVELIRETCLCDDWPSVIPLWDFFDVLKQPNGIEYIGKQIGKVKMDLRGRTIIILSHEGLLSDWESKWQDALIQFSLRESHGSSPILTFFGLLYPFTVLNNFTFEFLERVEENATEFAPFMSVAETIVGNEAGFPSSSLSLYKFGHYRSYFFTRPIPPDSARLSSLTSPLSEPAASIILLILAAIMAILLLELGTKRWFRDLPEAVLLTFSSFIGKTWNVKGNSKFLLLYTTWLFLVGCISMTYTNVLQSVVVVPGFRYNGLTFEEMLQRNYTFESGDWSYMKGVVHLAPNISTKSRDNSTGISVMEKEKILSRIVLARGDDGPISWNELVLMYSEANKRAAVEYSTLENRYKMAGEAFGWDVVAGQERFFNVPTWWSAEYVERASLLINSIDRLKEFGFVPYFLQLCEERFYAALRSSLHEVCAQPEGSGCVMDETGTPVPVNDPLITECLLLLLYGMSAAIGTFIAETTMLLFVKTVRGGLRAQVIAGRRISFGCFAQCKLAKYFWGLRTRVRESVMLIMLNVENFYNKGC